MAAPALPVRLALAGACGLLLVGGIAGAATVKEDDKTISGTGPAVPDDVTSTTGAGAVPGEALPPAAVPGASDPTTTATTGAPSTTVAGAATTTTRPRAGGATTPGALVAPKPGDYVYEATTTGAGSSTSRSTTKVEAAGSEGATTIQAVTIPLDLGGQQATARNTVAWAAGATVRRSVISAAALGQQQLDCMWQPAFLQYAGGLAVGKAWSYDTRCAGKVQGIDILIEQKAARRVTGSAPAAAAGGTVPTWTIADDTTVVVTTPFGATSIRTVGTQQLAPSLGVPVSTRSTVESRMAGAPPSQSTVTTKLLTAP